MAKPIPLAELPVIDRKHSAFPAPDRFAKGAVIPVDKPAEWTSFDVVRFVRGRIAVRKVGHAGTLDPLATGLLILCSGRATRSISQIQEQPKRYLAEITFGASTPSFDSATDVTETAGCDHLTEGMLEEAIATSFSGNIRQVPPVYSALWKDGKRMYKLARKGVEEKPDPREVSIYGIELLEFNLPKVTLDIRCGKGFYVRSLANDLARAVGSLGYLSSLRRTAIGGYSVGDAWSIEQFDKWSSHGQNDPS